MADDRPKPKYGELAPEGWKWAPPAPPAGSDTAAPVGEAGGQPAGGGSSPTATPSPGYGVRDESARASGTTRRSALGPAGRGSPRGVNIVDVTVTSILLFFGVLISASMIPALFDFSTVLSQAAAMQGYGTFTASSSANTAGFAAGIATILLLLTAIAISVRRISRQKLAFPVPLIFGLVTLVVWLVVISYAFFNDPAFVEQVLTTPPAS